MNKTINWYKRRKYRTWEKGKVFPWTEPASCHSPPLPAGRERFYDSMFLGPASPQSNVVRMLGWRGWLTGRGLDIATGRDDRLSGDGTKGYG